MKDAWKVMMESGLPDGPPRPKPTQLDAQRLKNALRQLMDEFDHLGERKQELLRAYLKGFRHHWPRRFTEILGSVGERCHARVEGTEVDPNRYLKLRRIAIANLSGIL